jgi:hypothetical protein
LQDSWGKTVQNFENSNKPVSAFLIYMPNPPLPVPIKEFDISTGLHTKFAGRRVPIKLVFGDNQFREGRVLGFGLDHTASGKSYRKPIFRMDPGHTNPSHGHAGGISTTGSAQTKKGEIAIWDCVDGRPFHYHIHKP